LNKQNNLGNKTSKATLSSISCLENEQHINDDSELQVTYYECLPDYAQKSISRDLSKTSNTITTFLFGNKQSNAFFAYDKQFDGCGLTCLITRAIRETPVLISHVLNPIEICYHIRVGKFVSQLTIVQREEFVHIIR
jgi:hypothetical protein